MKRCTICNIEKELIEFAKSKPHNQGVKNQCKKCINKWYKEHYKKNKNIINSKHKEYRENNKEKEVIRHKIYLQNNKLKVREYHKNKRLKNPLFRLDKNIRSSIKSSFKRKNHNKNNKSRIILGCEIEYFKSYIESKFENWMNWENYGKYNGELFHGWDLDHIVPIDSASNEEELIKLNHYTNFQPLCSKTNRDIKRNKLCSTS